MKINTIKVNKIFPGASGMSEILDKYLSTLSKGSILVITSKIIALTEGRFIKKDKLDKNRLIAKEADYYLSAEKSKYNVTLTVKNGILIANSGIDESNGAGFYILWPKNPQKSANKIRKYLQKRFSISKVGVIITDSRVVPLRWGTTGIAIGYSGFQPIRNYIGKKDIFGRKLAMTKANLLDGLAAAAVLEMGEGNEQTPISVIENIPFIKFLKRNPAAMEIKNMQISLADDLYSPLLTGVKWQKGGSKK